MNLKGVGLDGWHNGGRRLFQGNEKISHDNGSTQKEKLNRNHTSNRKPEKKTEESNNLSMKNLSLVKDKDFK